MRYIKKLFPQTLKNIYHLAQAFLANAFFGFPARKLKVIGITGTDGKTTTTQMVAKVLEESGKRVAMASTINFSLAGQEEKNLSHFTTLSAFAVQRFIRRAVRKNCEYLVLETSSHSLDQYRVWGIDFRIAVITNVTREHLDYHKTMENYRKAKARLFEKARIAIVNADMDQAEEFLRFGNEEKITYGIKNSADIKAEKIELSAVGSKFTVKGVDFSLSLPGGFNVENALAAISVGTAEGVGLNECAKALANIRCVPGRMESIPNEKGLNIIVDFALTPDALKKLYGFLASAKAEDGNKIIAVFGSCGERDRGKRPLMGGVVSKYADYIVLTNDEPYHEDPDRIIEEIAAGITDKVEGAQYWKIADRRQAIAKALSLAKTEDIVVVTGMGNFETMVVGDEKIPWNDKVVIEEELKKL